MSAMKPTKQRKGNTPSSKACPISSGSKKGMKRGAGQQEKENVVPGVTKTSAEGRLSLLPSEKLKLQLYPVDQVTRMGLEKDGHNPYLELTLKARKKISSVLKHIHDKWGGSSIAAGELTIFPYYTEEKPAGGCRWTMNDLDITAGEVYVTIGSPVLFRMRYGWFSNAETKSCRQPHTSEAACAFPLSNFTELKDIQKPQSFTNMVNFCHIGGGAQVTNEELKPAETSEGQTVTNNALPDHVVNVMGIKENADWACGQSASLWADSLMNISIGGLLSEETIQGILNNSTSKAAAQPSSIICDSFDAYIAANINRPPQCQPMSSNRPCSSIFDAEETCHAFPKRNNLSEYLPTSSGTGTFGSFNQSSPTPSKISKTNKQDVDDDVQIESVASEDDARQESETDLLLCSRVYSDERSLGLAGISWTDTRGPFDLGLPSRKVLNGESGSNSISGLAR